MAKVSGRVGDADQALAVPAEPCSTVSALTGFDPSRKSEVFQAQLNLITRRSHLANSIDAAAALRWLYDYGQGVLNGGTYGTDFSDSKLAKPYLDEARSAFAKQMFDHAVEFALADMESGLASAIEAPSGDKTAQQGLAEGESATGEAGDAQGQSA